MSQYLSSEIYFTDTGTKHLICCYNFTKKYNFRSSIQNQLSNLYHCCCLKIYCKYLNYVILV